MWEGAEKRVDQMRTRLERAGYKIQRLEDDLTERRGAEDDEAATLTLVERLKALHHVVLRTGKCACGKDARCPTLRLVESA